MITDQFRRFTKENHKRRNLNLKNSTFNILMDIQAGDICWKAETLGENPGTGPKLLVALHGYGQDSSVFRHLAGLLGSRYTFLAIDLAFHGKNKDLPKGFEFDELYARKWVEAILAKTGKSELCIAGYSIGARIALSVASWCPEQVNELLLLAPDGLPVSSSYKLLTSTLAGNNRFRASVTNPGLAFSLIRIGQALKIIPPKAADFFRNEIATRGKRQQLYDCWMAYRNAIPDGSVLRKRSLSGKLIVTCVLGHFDSVIPFKKTRRRLLKILPDARIIELKMGHNLVSEKSVKKLSEFLKA